METVVTPGTLAGAWTDAVAEHGDRTFLIYENLDGATRAWTYGEFHLLVDRAAARLAALGVGPGTAVHLALANSTSFVTVWLAAARLGAWIVPSDPASSSRELGAHVARTRPAVGLCATARREPCRAAADEAGLAHVIEVDESELEPGWLGASRQPGSGRRRTRSTGRRRCSRAARPGARRVSW